MTSKVIDELPDPFRFETGHRVQTKAEWALRRGEILQGPGRLIELPGKSIAFLGAKIASVS